MTDPVPTFSYLLREIRNRHPRFSYVHFVEAEPDVGGSLDFARQIWHANRPEEEHSVLLSCGNHDRESALKNAEKGDVVVFGRPFTSNPDLVRRLREDIPLAPFDFGVFYTKMDPKGYIDYPFAEDSKGSKSISQAVEAAAAVVARA